MIIFPLKHRTHSTSWEFCGTEFLQTKGHCLEKGLYLQEIVSTPASIYCKFCQFVGKDKKYYRAYQSLQELIVNTYLTKGDEKDLAKRENA